MRKFSRNLYIVLMVLLLPVCLYAPPGGSWNPGDTDPTVPLSGGIAFFAIAGLIYGIRNFIRNKKL